MSKLIVIHCSDTVNFQSVSVETIDRWHRERGFSRGIGYHKVFQPDGSVDEGRDMSTSGAHARGYNNSYGFCLIGRDKFTETAINSLYVECSRMKTECETWNISTWNPVISHRDLTTDKTCPNFDAHNWYALCEMGFAPYDAWLALQLRTGR